MTNLPQKSQMLIYQTESGQTKVGVHFYNDNVWLTQKLMAQLFGCSADNISLHLRNIFKEGELRPASVAEDSSVTASDGKKYKTKLYNLEAIIAVGYRVKSPTATHFRQWATEKLSEYIVKGFVLDDERLKNPDLPFDYFEELTRRIQDIRTSEKRFYRKITDIYATSVDYDPTDPLSIEFFQTVQNKVHFAITGQTAAEIIISRVNSKKKDMGLTNWRGERVRKKDVVIAKNYLNEKELLALNNLVEQYLIFAEGQAMRRVPMYMKDWIKKLEDFLKINDRDILQGKGKVSAEQAKDSAENEYGKFNQIRANLPSPSDQDFDKAVRMIKETKKSH